MYGIYNALYMRDGKKFEKPPLQSYENPEKCEAVEKIAATLEDRLERDFSDKEKFPFHNIEHSRRVATDTRKFLEIIRNVDLYLVSKEDLEYASILGYAHDIMQNAELKEGKMLERHRGYEMFNRKRLAELEKNYGKIILGNEEESARILTNELNKYRDVFDDETKTTLRSAIGATYTEAEFAAVLPKRAMSVTHPDGRRETLNQKYTVSPKFFQPELTPESSLLALALATADIRGTVGAKQDFKEFREDGNNEFLELQQKAIVAEIKAGIERISPERRNEIIKTILGWVKFQVPFAIWQRELFHESIKKNERAAASGKRKEIIAALNAEYRFFDQNIIAARDRYERLEKERILTGEQSELNDEKFSAILREIGIR